MNVRRLIIGNLFSNSACGRCCSAFGFAQKLVFSQESGVLAKNGLSNSVPRWLHISTAWLGRGRDDRRALIESMPRTDEGADGEKSFDLGAESKMKGDIFPDMNTPNMMVDGVAFSELPVCHIKVSLNNTLMTLVDHKGNEITRRTCGMEGFKNAKKGTNIAAQATAVTLGMNAKELGVKNIRVKIRGLGPGRMSSLKGLMMSGMNVVSISDCTPVPYNGPRPRKQRKL